MLIPSSIVCTMLSSGWCKFQNRLRCFADLFACNELCGVADLPCECITLQFAAVAMFCQIEGCVQLLMVYYLPLSIALHSGLTVWDVATPDGSPIGLSGACI